MLVTGLGNPGPSYAQTRHNAGFLVVDALAARLGLRWKEVPYRALQAQGQAEGRRIVLLKPMTYMNLSGQAVAGACRKLHLGPAEVLAVCDDLDLPPGRVRVRARGSAGGHRGLISLIQELGSQEFGRVRVGIGRPPAGVDVVDYVLEPFTQAEAPALEAAVQLAGEAVLAILREGFEAAMNQVNGPGGAP